jgi:hypothetical protein
MHMKTLRRLMAATILAGLSAFSFAVSGEMGTGTPDSWGQYSAAVGDTHIRIFNLTNRTTAFPAGCSYITISSATVGADAYKMVLASMLIAKSTGKKMRFFAHAARDGGCGVDYFEMQS